MPKVIPLALRWLLVVPVGLAAAWAGIVAGLVLYSITDDFCPRDLLVSGSCMAWWAPLAHSAGLSLGATLGAALVVALPAWVAPRFRHYVATAAFAAGCVFIGMVTRFGIRDPALFAAPVVSGLAVLWWFHARTRRSERSDA